MLNFNLWNHQPPCCFDDTGSDHLRSISRICLPPLWQYSVTLTSFAASALISRFANRGNELNSKLTPRSTQHCNSALHLIVQQCAAAAVPCRALQPAAGRGRSPDPEWSVGGWLCVVVLCGDARRGATRRGPAAQPLRWLGLRGGCRWVREREGKRGRRLRV